MFRPIVVGVVGGALPLRHLSAMIVVDFIAISVCLSLRRSLDWIRRGHVDHAQSQARGGSAAAQDTHLRTILRHTEADRIVITVNELIADTETQLVKLKPDPGRKVSLH